MKRRKHKRHSKAARQTNKPAEIEQQGQIEKPVDIETSAGIKEPPDIERPADVETSADIEEPEIEKPVRGSVAPTVADRRSHPRYEFTAVVEVAEAKSGKRVEARVRDLSQQGCYVDTESPLPLEAATEVRITKAAHSFEARARVIYSQASKGMGLVFTAIESKQLETLERWLADSRETSWLASNRRRSQRVLMKIPVRVSGRNRHGSPFEEETQTLAVSAHGALISVSTQVKKGQRLALTIVHTKAALECVVAHIKSLDDLLQVGVEFTLPNPTFWHVAFPPKDWTPRHPDAKFPP